MPIVHIEARQITQQIELPQRIRIIFSGHDPKAFFEIEASFFLQTEIAKGSGSGRIEAETHQGIGEELILIPEQFQTDFKGFVTRSMVTAR